MFEKALTGNKAYWNWMLFLLLIMGAGGVAYLQQFTVGLGITGMSRDVSWGIYIGQFTFLVGVAASAVMLVLPYYLHNYKVFGKMVILGEFLAIAAVSMCMMFIMADLGKPMRALNVMLYATPNSILFWDMIVLSGYLGLNILCGWVVLESDRKDVPPPAWIKPFIYLSIPWAVSIHTVTAFLYAGLPGRHLWLTAIMAPRFLASAFSSGPALLIILALIVKRVTDFDPGKEAIQKLAVIVTYAAVINVFFVGLECFTAFYSSIPSHAHALTYLFAGLEEHGHHYGNLVPWMRVSALLALVSILMLLNPGTKKNEGALGLACLLLFLAFWIDKGMGLVLGGFVPSPLEEITEYYPTLVEITITIAIWATGFFILSAMYKIAIAIRREKEA
jgi:molybdopterin-containing oxidoreductase family membrane subunit